MFIAMLQHKDFEKTDFSYMRTGIMAGSPCPIAVMQDVVNKMNMKEIIKMNISWLLEVLL